MRNLTRASRSLGLLLCVIVLVAAGRSQTSKPKPAQPAKAASQVQYKGIWEPVNYNADVKLLDVYFTTAHEGWVAGGKTELRGGIVLHTVDGGTHWDVVYGDPESSDRAVHGLRFLDRTVGWAIQDTGSVSRLLHTSDGQNWSLAGTIAEHAQDYMFTSETNGVALQNARILHTSDGGRTWKQVGQCQASITVSGLARNVNCEWARLQFLTTDMAIAIGFNRSARDVIFLGRTSDGGATWTISTAKGSDIPQDAFFLSQDTGYLRSGAPDTGQVFKTTDAGETWIGMAASPGARIQFADPEVGWAVQYNKVSFTTDGGSHWNSRQYPFPARVNAFNLPRRDRGYVVGEHGMIFRYRLVRSDYTSKGMIPAPLLSGITSPLDDEVEELAAEADAMAAQAGVPAEEVPAPAKGDDDDDSDKNAAQPAAPAGPFEDQVKSAAATFARVAGETPSFVSKYRNLNLLMTGAMMVSGIPEQVQQLKETMASLKGVKDPKASAALITNLHSQAASLRQQVRAAFQKR